MRRLPGHYWTSKNDRGVIFRHQLVTVNHNSMGVVILYYNSNKLRTFLLRVYAIYLKKIAINHALIIV